jgi:hypothetical protein
LALRKSGRGAAGLTRARSTVDLSQFADEELREQLEGMRLALCASFGSPFNGREEGKNADLLPEIEAIKAELDRRNGAPGEKTPG